MKLQTEASQPRPLVLVVDDFADNREMYSEYLSFSGYDEIGRASCRERV